MLTSVTAAPGSRPPWASDTVPSMTPVVACDCAKPAAGCGNREGEDDYTKNATR